MVYPLMLDIATWNVCMAISELSTNYIRKSKLQEFEIIKFLPQNLKYVAIRGETIWVNAILHIVFECIAIYFHIAIFDWILVKRRFIWEYGFWQ